MEKLVRLKNLNNLVLTMNTKKKLIDCHRLVLLIEVRHDQTGKESFVVSYADKVIRFREMSSVLDFVNMNKGNLGYVE